MGSSAPTSVDSRASASGFEALAALPDERIDVPLGAALVARDEYPTLDVARVVADLASMGAPLAPRNLASAPLETQAAELAAHVFGSLGFRGNEKEYYDPKNSLLSDVLARRLGIPITLAIVYCDVAQRAGLCARGVGFPGHFLVRLESLVGEGAPLFVDPFYAGRVLDDAALGRMITRARGPDAKLQPEDLAPASSRAILVRVLTNLKAIHLQRGDHARALLALDRIVTLSPRSTNALKERGLVAARLGANEAARADLARVLELEPEASDAAALRAQLAKLTKSRAALN